MSKKIFMEVPIPIRCNLKCRKCFHAPAWAAESKGEKEYLEKYHEKAVFTPQELVAWRDKFIGDYDEYLVELQGGECSYDWKSETPGVPGMYEVVFSLIEELGKNGKTKFQLQSNGLGNGEFYHKLFIKYGHMIDRIGFTYHRDELTERSENECKRLNETFNTNVDSVLKLIKTVEEMPSSPTNHHIHFYVKEILFPKYRDELREAKKYWENKGIEYRVQPYRSASGRDGYKNAIDDRRLLHPEYVHAGETCSCRELYGIGTNVIIRGYDYFAGDVLACWHNQLPVGSVTESWYKGGYYVSRDAYDVISIKYGDKPVTYIPPTNKRPDDSPVVKRKGPEIMENPNELTVDQFLNDIVDDLDGLRNQQYTVRLELEKAEKHIQSVIDRIKILNGKVEGFETVLKRNPGDHETSKDLVKTRDEMDSAISTHNQLMSNIDNMRLRGSFISGSIDLAERIMKRVDSVTIGEPSIINSLDKKNILLDEYKKVIG